MVDKMFVAEQWGSEARPELNDKEGCTLRKRKFFIDYTKTLRFYNRATPIW